MQRAHKNQPLLRTMAGRALGFAIIAVAAAPAAPQSPVLPDKRIDISERTWGVSGAGHYLAARKAEADYDYPNAAKFYEAALGRDPNNLRLREKALFLLVAEGRVADAKQHARAVLREKPTEYLPVLTTSILDFAAGRYEQAITQMAVLDNTGHVGFIRRVTQAWAAAGMGDLIAAKAALGLNSGPEVPNQLLAIQGALIEDVAGGDPAKAYQDLDAKFGDTPGRIRDLIANYQERAAGKDVPPSVASVGDGLAQIFASFASGLTRGQNRDLGLTYTQLGRYLAPENEQLALLLADLMYRQERHRDAARAYDLVSESSPLYYDAQVERSRSLARADDIETALTVAQAVAGSQPNRAAAVTLMGDIYRGEARFEEAAASYDKAFAQLGDAATDNWRLHYRRGIVRERSGAWEKAEADLSRALEIKKDQPLVLNYLGYSWIDRGENLEKAKGMVRRAAALRPEDGFIADSVGWAAYRTGDMEEAVAEMERAVALEPLDPTINEHLGDVYWAAGRRLEANYQWEKAMALDPLPERVAELEKRLRCGLDPCD